MIVVADASPLNYLVLIEQIDLLAIPYQRVLIPQTVLSELQHPRAPAPVATWIANAAPWVEVRAVHGVPDEGLKALDPGERDAVLRRIELLPLPSG